MAKVVGGMTMSLDGFVSGEHGGLDRLYMDLAALLASEVLREEIRTTGAIVMGRTSFNMGDPDSFADSYEYQVPIFVLTHHPPAKLPKQNERLTVTFVSGDIEPVIAWAKTAAGERNVLLIGVSVNHQCLRAGLCDELHFGIVPALLGSGKRFFDGYEVSGLRLEKFRSFEEGDRADLWYRVVR